MVYLCIFRILLGSMVQRPFIGVLTEQQKEFKASMSSVRISVEHNCKDIKQNWVSQDFSRNLKVRKSPVGLLYHPAAFLWNFRICFYCGGGQVQSRYHSTPLPFGNTKVAYCNFSPIQE